MLVPAVLLQGTKMPHCFGQLLSNMGVHPSLGLVGGGLLSMQRRDAAQTPGVCVGLGNKEGGREREREKKKKREP